MNKVLDCLASWLVGLRITRWLAWHGFKSCHLIPLCIARAIGVTVRWHHLTGRLDINDVDRADRALVAGRRHD